MNGIVSKSAKGAEVVDLVDVVLAGALGAALLAVALLYSGYRRNRALIIELRAELRACSIGSALPGSPDAHDDPPGLSRRVLSRLRRTARRLMPKPRRKKPAEPAADQRGTTNSVGVRTKEEVPKEPYGSRSIPASAPVTPTLDSEAPSCDIDGEARSGGGGGAITRGPLTLLQ